MNPRWVTFSILLCNDSSGSLLHLNVNLGVLVSEEVVQPSQSGRCAFYIVLIQKVKLLLDSSHPIDAQLIDRDGRATRLGTLKAGVQ